jgi:hypothetical protein
VGFGAALRLHDLANATALAGAGAAGSVREVRTALRGYSRSEVRRWGANHRGV